jgi:hypothetical protein
LAKIDSEDENIYQSEVKALIKYACGDDKKLN